MAVEPARPSPDLDPADAAPLRVARPAESSASDIEPENSGTELLVYGTDEILKGTDMGTLVAFAALAFQQIRGKGEPHHGLGCILLLFSVLMCAIVHLAIGNAYVGRAKMILKRRQVKRRHHLVRQASYGIAWLAATGQFLSLVIGMVLIMLEKTPPLLLKYFKPLLQL
jgi:hypothetical protein